MKRNKIYAWMAAAMTLAACSTNDIADITANDADNVVNIASVTRSGETGNTTAQQMTAPFHLINVTQMAKFDMKYEADYTFDNNTYSVNGLVVWCNSYDNEFQAFSPLHTSANNASFTTFTIPTDQSTADQLAAADWMTATTTEKKGNNNGAISLNFEHQLSNIVITISEDAKSDLASLSDIKVLGTITPYYNSTTKTIQAIVEPATTVPNTSLLTFNDATGESYTIPFPSSITSLDKGKQYNFTLSGGHNTLTISSVSVTDWTQASVATGKENEAWNGSNALKLTFSGDLTGAKLVLTYHYTEPQTSNNAKTRTPDASISQKILSNCIEIRKPTAEGIEVEIRSEKNSSIAEIPLNNDANIVLLSSKGINKNGTTNFTFSDNENPVPGYLTIGVTGNNANGIGLDVSGDLRSLVDASEPKNADTSEAKFTNLFKDCKQLKSFKKIQLNQMAENCCEGMFENSGLEQSPILPDTTSVNCYKNMFKNCIDLKQVELPAAGLSSGCYNGVLSGCVNLEYLKLGVTKENLKTLNDKENPPFGNFLGQNDNNQEITDDDATYNSLTAGSNTTQRTLVVNVGVDINELGLPPLWKDTDEGTNVLFLD
ncbi:hypothetical protein CIK99_09480 [Prevotella sp. P5-92]|uniref:fimbrillin family protein n=1 Tax=Prevotella sp. P5-92 TaxID=2024222 RepID=UPI000B96F3D4|nr:fimbrillin family protein [Prevotella sp. P5-92]OYP56490.1 hypothetical protein CIK99_09480 [Prevotella sp. P5-92]